MSCLPSAFESSLLANSIFTSSVSIPQPRQPQNHPSHLPVKTYTCKFHRILGQLSLDPDLPPASLELDSACAQIIRLGFYIEPGAALPRISLEPCAGPPELCSESSVALIASLALTWNLAAIA
ncbi:hypothetical protein AXF42_Ash014771 [Apostasia shenzhenica]|uniref:Uncharacterized protein n=1 Tax=Apostasia shenzhenica TaxID=1088818 RepID=A0A2H9ZW86_9ASPA|nr:hypothetical protein AXF42_Ash014771 [Apostasia shenzhenica]